jgi:eukaryotic-like serine/threonine-protein kinase
MTRFIREALGPGDQIGPYQLEAELGHGGMGRVFRARDSRLGRVVAIKVILSELASDEGFQRRFRRDARTIATLNHPHVCAIYDIAEHEGCAYLVMEYVEGETLDKVLTRRARSTNEVLAFATEMASALAAAHGHGIVHRDLKPGNIMVTPFGAKVLDFGLAKEAARLDPHAEKTLATAALTEPGRIAGTPDYMSPEQVGSKPLDARSDIFAAGVILYEMLNGRRPFRGTTAVETMAAILQVTPAVGPRSRHPARSRRRRQSLSAEIARGSVRLGIRAAAGPHGKSAVEGERIVGVVASGLLRRPARDRRRVLRMESLPERDPRDVGGRSRGA